MKIVLCVIQVGPARFRAPELLFRPDLVGEECEGIHEVGNTTYNKIILTKTVMTIAFTRHVEKI